MDGEGNASAEAAIEEAISVMYSMCANAGQDKIIQLGENTFTDWAEDVFNSEFVGDGPTIQDLFADLLFDFSASALHATDEIWSEGAKMISHESRAEVIADQEYEHESLMEEFFAEREGEEIDEAAEEEASAEWGDEAEKEDGFEWEGTEERGFLEESAWSEGAEFSGVELGGEAILTDIEMAALF